MPRQLARVLGFLSPRPRIQQSNLEGPIRLPFKPEVTNEVSECNGILLVRLGRGSAMQVRLQPDRAVSIRTVPIAQATQLEGGAPWQTASDAQLRSWIQSDSAVWRWLLAKGIHQAKARATEDNSLTTSLLGSMSLP
jgi:hypothetical protein